MSKGKQFLNYLYFLANQKRDTNLLTIYDKAAKTLKAERLDQLTRICKATDLVAIHALLMTPYQRSKNRDRHLNVNGQTFYLFDRRSVWSFGVVTEPEKYIYTK